MLVIARAPLPLVELQGPAHLVSYVNAAFCRLVGKASGELIGIPFSEIFPGGDECGPLLDGIYQPGEAGTPAAGNGAETEPACWLHARWPALDPTGRPVDVVIQMMQAPHSRQIARAIKEALLISGLHQHELTEMADKMNAQLEQEITVRKLAEAALLAAKDQLTDRAGELERLVAERTGQLRETIGELEAFSYSVAHDMRAPLRGMQGFAQILLDEHAGRLGTEALGYLKFIVSSAARMDALIQDVLNYTRVLRGEARMAPVDLDRLVRNIVSNYPEWQPPKVHLAVEGTLPVVLGHEGFLTQCVTNLLSNAVKFVAPGITPRIRIWAEDGPPLPVRASRPPAGGMAVEARGNGGPVVRVWFENNGIGIAPKDRGRVFRMFGRINPNDQFEGTGIGMTIARKAVERMGGRIDFESELGQGSRFWVDLKKAPPAP